MNIRPLAEPITYTRSTRSPEMKHVAAAVATTLMSTHLLAAQPLGFDNWTANNGAITPTSCPVGAVCGTPTVDNGFMMRQVSVGGATYFQFILTEAGVTGDPTADPFSAARGNLAFTNEDIVMTNRPAGSYISGLASKVSITESTFPDATTENRFVYNAVTNMGGEVDPLLHPRTGTVGQAFNVVVHNDIAVVDYSGTSPTEIFKSTADLNVYQPYAAGAQASQAQDKSFTQYVDMGNGQEQNFKQRTISGYLQTSDRALDASNPLLPGGTNGGDVAWGGLNTLNTSFAKLDEIKATWVGQDAPTDALGNSFGDPFGHTAYQVGTAALFPPIALGNTALSRLGNASPGSWDPVFGATPTMTANHTVAPTATPPAAALPTGTFLPTTPLVGTGVAGPPVAYNEWTVSGGAVALDLPCPPTADSCGAPITTGTGLLQREITVAGIKYFQTIIADTTATGDPRVAAFGSGGLGFSSENFIRQNSSEGLASRSTLAVLENLPGGSGATARTAISTVLNTGWAQGGAADPTMVLNQAVSSDANVSYFKSSFDMKVAKDQSKDLYMEYRVGEILGLWPLTWATRIVQGGFQNTSRIAGAGTPLLAAGSNGGDIGWAPGEAIQVTWNGANYQTFDAATPFHYVNTLSYKNLVTGASTSSAKLLFGSAQFPAPNPESWINPFGAAPAWVSPISYP